MASVAETIGAKGQMAAGLAQGVETISLNEQVPFTLYVKMVMPLDGYVFWVNAALLSDSAIYNAVQYNRLEYDTYKNELPPRQFNFKGSFHYSTEMNQLEDRTTAYNHVMFTSLQEIQQLNYVAPNLMYVASYEGIKFAFSRRENFYKQADLYHYRGDALYSIMQTQLVDSVSQLHPEQVIVSNSLPIWLGLNDLFPMYPSYLVPQNIAPLFAAVDIIPAETRALQAFPLIAADSSHYQLVRDTVKITIYGTRNYNALDFVDYVLQYSLNTDNIGILNMPVVQDEKITQPEFGIIAMKKTITFEVSYYQQTARDIARQLIEHSLISLTPNPHP